MTGCGGEAAAWDSRAIPAANSSSVRARRAVSARRLMRVAASAGLVEVCGARIRGRPAGNPRPRCLAGRADAREGVQDAACLGEEADDAETVEAPGEDRPDEHRGPGAQDAPQLARRDRQVGDVMDDGGQPCRVGVRVRYRQCLGGAGEDWMPGVDGMRARMASEGSTAITDTSNQSRSAQEKAPVPAPTSSTRIPGCGCRWPSAIARRHPCSPARGISRRLPECCRRAVVVVDPGHEVSVGCRAIRSAREAVGDVAGGLARCVAGGVAVGDTSWRGGHDPGKAFLNGVPILQATRVLQATRGTGTVGGINRPQ